MCSGGGGTTLYKPMENRAEHSHQEFPGVPPGTVFCVKVRCKMKNH